jgi:hypothetical protein
MRDRRLQSGALDFLLRAADETKRTPELRHIIVMAVETSYALRTGPLNIDGRVFGWKAADSFEKAWVRCKARARASYEAECQEQGGKADTVFLSDLGFRDLRHEATSRLFERGLGIMEVASMT